MAKKVQIQLLDEQTGAVIDDANPVTTADLVKFDDGQTFQQKYDAGLLKGQKGDTGEGFSIFKTYASVAAMNADAVNVAQGKFVLIASDVENEDNAKLYVKGASGFTFLTDLSGAQGIKGEKGDQGLKGDTGATGAKGDTGAAGADGATWLTGTAAPTSAQVKNGDW